MFHSFLSALSYEFLHFLQEHDDFFSLSEEKRQDALDKRRMPAAFKAYLAGVSEKAFMADLSLMARFAAGDKQVNVKGSAFFKAFLEFLTGPFADKFDKLTASYFTFGPEDQRKVVDELIKSDSRVAETLKEIFMLRSPQELAEAVQSLSAKVAGSPYIVVQSPREMDAELKSQVRKSLREAHALSFPSFQINRKLIGGLRVFINGQTVDHSWLSRVHQFTSLTSA